MSPVVVLITRISTARYASLDLPPRPMPLNDRPPPVLEVFSSYAVTVPVTRYCAPVSLPIFAPVLGATRPDAARFCSSSTFCSLLRSTTRKSPLDDSSFESMPDSSQPTPPRHQEAPVSLRNSATPTAGRPSPPAAIALPAPIALATANAIATHCLFICCSPPVD